VTGVLLKQTFGHVIFRYAYVYQLCRNNRIRLEIVHHDDGNSGCVGELFMWSCQQTLYC